MNDREEARERHTAQPIYQVYTCGPFLVKQWDGTSYQSVSTGAWSGSQYPRLLLKALLASPGRQASRGRLQEILWPEMDPEDSNRYLNDAAYRLRGTLRPSSEDAESLLVTVKGTNDYMLVGPERLWVDVDAALSFLEQADERERQGEESLALLEEASTLLARGEFFAEEEHLLFYGKRARVARARRGCVLAQAKAYEQRGWLRKSETLLSQLLEEDALDEDALCALMRNLHQQGRTSEGLRLYEETKAVLAREGLVPTAAARSTEHQIRNDVPTQALPKQEAQAAQEIPQLQPPQPLPMTQQHHGLVLPCSSTNLQHIMREVTEQQLTTVASLLNLGDTIMFDSTKRQTLEALLAAISVALVQPQGLLQSESWKPLLASATDPIKVNAETIQGLQSLIEACWQLSRGNELALAEKLLPVYMTKVVPLAQQPSLYQQDAVNLAAQGFQLSSILALHRNDMQAQELYCKQAIQYSHLSGNQRLLIPTLRSLGTMYHYKGLHTQALQVYRDALPHVESVAPLQQACVYMSLAVGYAHIDHKQESLNYLGLALDTFPHDAEADPSFSYAEFDQPRMILWEGITRSRLGQTQQALEIFNRSKQPAIVISERTRIEIINQQAKTAIFAGDLEQGSTYVKTGLMGARSLGSQRRYSEAYENFQQMRLLWSQEKRVTELGELF